MKILETASLSMQSLASLGKCLLLSRRPSQGGAARGVRRLIIMGNGPSLRKTLDEERIRLTACDLMAVNFAANAPEFSELQPQYYVLADPHFFIGAGSDTNVARLWKNLTAVTWPMTLFIPCRRRKDFEKELGNRINRDKVRIKWFNLTPGEGLPAVSRFLYRKGLAMPRPRNVLIASLMLALREGYREIYIVGADHTWSQSLWVDDLNRVVSVQPHFYKDNPSELDRVAQEYSGYRLHDILNSLTIAFRSYWQIAGYAASLGARIINATPGSMIDAFPRAPLPDPLPDGEPVEDDLQKSKHTLI